MEKPDNNFYINDFKNKKKILHLQTFEVSRFCLEKDFKDPPPPPKKKKMIISKHLSLPL